MKHATRSTVLLGVVVLLSACGGLASAPAAPVLAPSATAARSSDWPQFGIDAQRSSASDAPSGITAANLGSLRRRRISLPGTVDSSSIYLHAVRVAGGARDVFVLTTTYGRTLAIDAANGAILWQYAPANIRSWEGSAQITNASPAADPSKQSVYAAAPDGAVRKLAMSDGHALWTARITREPKHEKLAGSLGISGSSVLAVTGGYLGDAPPYQGHVAAIAQNSGRVTAVFNTLCAHRHGLIQPSSCSASDSAIWARAGAVVEPGNRRVLVATGNGPYDGATNFGDSVLELSPGDLHLRQAFTPANQLQLKSSDTDLGSGGPILLPGGLVASGGKDGLLRVLDLRALNGRRSARPFRTGAPLQTLALPGRAPIFSAGAVSHGKVFVASAGGTMAYNIQGRRLAAAWSAPAHGSSPVLAGGLLFVFDPDGGKLNVYDPAHGRKLASLPAAPGHWNSPIVADGRIALPEGDANDHATRGTLDLFYVSG